MGLHLKTFMNLKLGYPTSNNMTIAQQLARHFSELHFGGNWTAVSVKEVLENISWKEAITTIPKYNNIATLVFHMHYYVAATLAAMRLGTLDAHDKYSFNVPEISSEEDWELLVQKVWDDAKAFSTTIEKFPDTKLSETFIDPKYGTYFRNINGIIEHTHYHLGQIVILKRMIKTGAF